MKEQTTKHKGNLTEMQCMLSFMEQGYNVLTPYGDCERYDFVADVKGKLIKVQCKTSSWVDDTHKAFHFRGRSVSTLNGNIIHCKYTKEEIDYFITFFENQCYLIPVEEVGGTKTLRLEPAQNGQTRGVSFAKDYKLEVVLKTL